MKELMDRFAKLYATSQDMESSYSLVGLACYEKLWWALTCNVFKEEFACPAVMNEVFQIYSGTEIEGCEVEEDGDMVLHETFFGSDICEYVSEYYEKSPYWDVNQQWATFYECEVDAMTEEQREDFCYLNRMKYEDFFEPDCLDLFKSGAENMPVECFQMEDDSSESCTVFRSLLLPYYLRLDRDIVKREHPDLATAVRSACGVFESGFAGSCWSIQRPSLSAAYYICFDGYDPYYGVGNGGSFCVDKALLLAGMVIDQAILKLDECYHFLPENLKGGSTCSNASAGK